jgi:ornithine cyclodeaminase/alanine dehydrogenase-like protein (mu-crystallin family)
VTTVHSSPRAALSGKLGSAELAAFISNVSFEGEILDSSTGERISALSDHRIGAKRDATAATSWASVRSAANQGAARLWQRFSAARGN